VGKKVYFSTAITSQVYEDSASLHTTDHTRPEEFGSITSSVYRSMQTWNDGLFQFFFYPWIRLYWTLWDGNKTQLLYR